MADNEKPTIVGRLVERYASQPAVQALLKLLPYWSSADVLIQQRAREIRHERTRIFFDALADGKVQLSEDLIQSDDFLHCYFKTVSAALNTRRKEKIQMFAHLLRYALDGDTFSSIEEYEEVLSIFDEVSYRELGVLVTLNGFEAAAAHQTFDSDVARIGSYWEAFRNKACEKFDISVEVFGPFMTRLERTALFTRNTDAFWDTHPGFGMTTQLFARLKRIVLADASYDFTCSGKE